MLNLLKFKEQHIVSAINNALYSFLMMHELIPLWSSQEFGLYGVAGVHIQNSSWFLNTELAMPIYGHVF